MKQKRVYNDVRLRVVKLSSRQHLLSGSDASSSTSGAPTMMFSANMQNFGTGTAFEQ